MFSSKKILLYLTGKSLKIFSDKYNDQLEFTKEAVSSQEVANLDKFNELLIGFLNKTNFKNVKATIILSDDLIFSKEFELIEKQIPQEEIQKFIDEVPFNPDQISKIYIPQKGKVVVVAGGNSLFMAIKKVCGNLDWVVEAVYPAGIFGEIASETNIASNSKKVLSKSGGYKKLNLLLSNDSDENNEKKSIHVSNLLIIIILIILTIGTAAIIFSDKIFKTASNLINNTQPVVATTTPTNAPTPTQIAYKSKSEMIVKILNGSGVAGQAGILKNELKQVGFSNITTDNYDQEQVGKSLISFSAYVSSEIKQEVLDTINKTISNLSTQESTNSAEDILIITGK